MHDVRVVKDERCSRKSMITVCLDVITLQLYPVSREISSVVTE